MEGKELFRSVMIGGYDKEEVINYVNSLECEFEELKIKFMMEKRELQDKLKTMEKELEKEQEDRLVQEQKTQEIQEEKEDACRRAEEVCLQKEEIQRQLEEVKGQLEEMHRCQQELEGQNSEKLAWMLNQIRQQENKLLKTKDKIKESIRRQKEEQQKAIESLQDELREREKECEYYSKEMRSRDIKIQEMEKARKQTEELRKNCRELTERCSRLEAGGKAEKESIGAIRQGIDRTLKKIDLLKRVRKYNVVYDRKDPNGSREKHSGENEDKNADVNIQIKKEEVIKRKTPGHSGEGEKIFHSETAGINKIADPDAGEHIRTDPENEKAAAIEAGRDRADGLYHSILQTQEKIEAMLTELQRDVNDV